MLLWPFNKYPGTDLESFNYDWVISKLKELKDSVAAALASEGLALLYRNAAKDFRDEAEGFADDAQDTVDSIGWVVDQVNTNTGRIDNLIATAGDGTIPSELTDIRVTWNGITYTTAGDAVRAQAEENNRLASEAVGITTKPGYIDGSGRIQDVPSDTNRVYTTPIAVREGASVLYHAYSNHANIAAVAFYDEFNTVISCETNTGSPDQDHTVTAPANTAYMRATYYTSRLDDSFVYFTGEGSELANVKKSTMDAVHATSGGDVYIKLPSANTRAQIPVTALPGTDVTMIAAPGYQIAAYYEGGHGEWTTVMELNALCPPEGISYVYVRKADNSSMTTTYQKVASIVNHKSVWIDAVNGLDTNTGTVDEPLQSISEGLNRGYKDLIVAPGTYNETVKLYARNDVTIRPNLYTSYDYQQETYIEVDNVIIDHCNNIKLVNILVDGYASNAGMYIVYSDAIDLERCAVLNIPGNHGYQCVNTNIKLFKCIAQYIGQPGGGNHLDGFSFHGYGISEVIDCTADSCEDDGVSHHDGCAGTITGGEYSNCGKGGVASPAARAAVNIRGVYSHDNRYGIYSGNDYSDTVNTCNICDCWLEDNTDADIYVKYTTLNVWNTIYDTTSIQTGGTINTP